MAWLLPACLCAFLQSRGWTSRRRGSAHKHCTVTQPASAASGGRFAYCFRMGIDEGIIADCAHSRRSSKAPGGASNRSVPASRVTAAAGNRTRPARETLQAPSARSVTRQCNRASPDREKETGPAARSPLLLKSTAQSATRTPTNALALTCATGLTRPGLRRTAWPQREANLHAYRIRVAPQGA